MRDMPWLHRLRLPQLAIPPEPWRGVMLFEIGVLCGLAAAWVLR